MQVDAPSSSTFVNIFSTEKAFAALKADGSITAWGNNRHGGYGEPTDNGYVTISSTNSVFAALKADGSIYGWGDIDYATTTIRGRSNAPTGNGYTEIFANNYAFAALKADGSITVWGDSDNGGSGAPTDNGYVTIYSTKKRLGVGGFAFAALKADGSITAWGDPNKGGSGAPTDNGYVTISSTAEAFAALKDDGSITAWGGPTSGGSGAPNSGTYTNIFSTLHAFAALKDDGSITVWGSAGHGGTNAPSGKYVNLVSAWYTFAAIPYETFYTYGAKHLATYTASTNSYAGSPCSSTEDCQLQCARDTSCAGYSLGAPVSFGSQNTITTQADGAWSVYAADLDGDGDIDVLSASQNDDKIAWYENTDGQGTLSTQKTISTQADGAQSVYAADLDGDGDMDVLSASYNDDKIAWYENTGQGTFSSQKTITTLADGANCVYAADIDGDGDMDVLSASYNDDEIAWYENRDGQGTFSSQKRITFQAVGAQSVFAADLDGDGDMDVLSASKADNKIAWYENTDGQGTFNLMTQNTITTQANGAFSVYAADIDGDGDMDVLSASAYNDKIAWYENTGQGIFSTQKTITTQADAAQSVYAVDMDGDGDMDVFSASLFDDKIAWYENTDGQGTFSSQKTISTQADGARSVYAADIDGDGNIDVLSASHNDNKIAWYENKYALTAYGAATGTAGGFAIDASTRMTGGGFEKSSRNLIPELNKLSSAPSTALLNTFAATTATADELNVLDEVDPDLDVADLNKLKDVISTASELNKMGTASSLAQLNAMSTTASTAEMNRAGSVLVAGSGSLTFALNMTL